MSDWRTMKDPALRRIKRDGTAVLLYSEMWEMTWGIQIGTFGDGQWQCGEGSASDDDEDEYGPTHWMLLPEGPRDE